MSEVRYHILDPSRDTVRIDTMDAPGPGGGHHEYLLQPMTTDHPIGAINPVTIKFQKGGIAEVGVNGLTHEALLAVIIHRLESFQGGPFPCEENELALLHCRQALVSLQLRTRKRIARGVEGKVVA